MKEILKRPLENITSINRGKLMIPISFIGATLLTLFFLEVISILLGTNLGIINTFIELMSFFFSWGYIDHVENDDMLLFNNSFRSIFNIGKTVFWVYIVGSVLFFLFKKPKETNVKS